MTIPGNTSILTLTFGLVVMATIWLSLASRARGPSARWLILTIPILVIEIILRSDPFSTFGLRMLAMVPAVILGVLLAHTIGQLPLPPSRSIRKALSKASGLTEALADESTPNIELGSLSTAAIAVADVVRIARPQLGFFTVGTSAALCDQLIGLQTALEARLLKQLDVSTYRIMNAESRNYVEVWQRQSAQLVLLLRLVNDSIGSLTARVQQYRQLTAITIATIALVASLLNVLMRTGTTVAGR